VAGVPGSAPRRGHCRHPLRDEVVEVRDHVERVSLDTLLDRVETSVDYVLAFCDGGYTANYLSRTSPMAGPGLSISTAVSRWRRSTAARPGCSYRICAFGSPRSGCVACSCQAWKNPASGSRWATTSTVTRGANSDTPATDVAARDRRREHTRDAHRPPVVTAHRRLGRSSAGTARRRTSDCA
jgi:hypothetical protein